MNLALAFAVAWLARSAASVDVTAPGAATAMWTLFELLVEHSQFFHYHETLLALSSTHFYIL